MNYSPLQLQMIAEHEALLAGNPSAAFQIPFINDYLLACEYELILYMIEKGVWTGPMPLSPPNFKTGDGAIEFGLFLYWFNNPNLLNDGAIALIAGALDWALDLSDSQMTSANYTFLCNNELIYVDGSVLSTETWATFDQGWFTAFINLLETFHYVAWYNNGVFPMPSPPKPVALSGAIANTVSIAIVGDWGTGDAASASVMQQIVSLKPDYIIHLGDVYYGGTPATGDPSGAYYYSLNEEATNLVNAWPKAYAGKSFTLNSNHEMYSGANGLFSDALNPPGSPFSAQGKLSCFVLQYGGWTILGLDSAYNGTSADAFMSGNLGIPPGPQVAWIKSLKLNPLKTIVLTHHLGFAYDCSSVLGLWPQVNAALGGDPYAWYWGHAHNGIVYKTPVTIPVPGQPDFTTKTYARCAGHGALPYGVATALQKNPYVAWQANSPLPPPSTQIYNGFVLLTLQSSNDQVTSISEAFFDPSSGQPKWNLEIYGSCGG